MDETKTRPHGAWLFYIVAFVATLVSIDTSWRFFGERLHITNLYERPAMFAVIELTFVACGVAMRGNVRRGNGPGAARMLVWALCGAAGYMAFDLAGPVEGLARVALGPVLAVVCLHLALGIEIKTRLEIRGGTWSRIGRELRERALSRLGLADDQRDALARTRDRAAVRAARLATGHLVLARRARLARAVRASGAALDVGQRESLLAQVAAYRSLYDLVTLDRPSPWTDNTTPVPVPSVPVQRRPSHLSIVPTSGGPAIGWDMDKVVAMLQRGEPDSEIVTVAGVSAKQLQRTKRVVRAIASGATDLDIVRGDITPAFVRKVRETMGATQ